MNAAGGLITDYSLLEDASAVFDTARTYRYLLTRTWGTAPPAVFLMLNPSTADAIQDDPTIRRCTGFARREGCGGLHVVNLFALRATDPRQLVRHPAPVGPCNDQFIRTRCGQPGVLVVAAWGAHGARVGQDRHVTAMLSEGHAVLACLGVTRSGAPKHPLYLPASAPLMPFPAVPVPSVPASRVRR